MMCCREVVVGFEPDQVGSYEPHNQPGVLDCGWTLRFGGYRLGVGANAMRRCGLTGDKDGKR